MSRFDRQGTESSDLPALLGSATEEFRRSLERHVEQIVESAKDHAAEIERDAHREAKEREQQLDVRSQELVQGVINRASSVLDSIELVQTAISGMLAELRSEVKALQSGGNESSEPAEPSVRVPALLGADQRLAKEAPVQPNQKPVAPPASVAPARPAASPAPQAPPKIEPARVPVPARESRPEAPSQLAAKPSPAAAQPRSQAPAVPPQASAPTSQAPAPTSQAPAPVEAETTAQTDRKGDSSAEFDQMIHGEIRRMFQSGKSREEVEGFLGRFELGDNYMGLLDELYSQKDPSGRRRIFGRRRDR